MKNPAIHTIGALLISLSLVSGGGSYVLPAERMLDPFLEMLRGVHTVAIDMGTTIYDKPDHKTEIREQLLIKTGGRFRDERTYPTGSNTLIQDGRRTVIRGVEIQHAGARRIDTVFPTIFFQQSEDDLLNALNFLGVDTHTVGIDRIEREVVFVVGKGLDQGPGSRLWVEHERRLPLRFVGVGISGGEPVVLRAEYKEYRQVDEDVWFPGRIEYYRDGALWVVSILYHISFNENLDEGLFRVPESGDVGFPVTEFLNIKE